MRYGTVVEANCIEVEEKEKTKKEDRPHASPSFNVDGSMQENFATKAAANGFVLGSKVRTLKKFKKVPKNGLCKIVKVDTDADAVEIQFGEPPSADFITTEICNLELIIQGLHAKKPKTEAQDIPQTEEPLKTKAEEPKPIVFKYLTWKTSNDHTGIDLVKDLISTTMKRVSLLSGGDPSHVRITEDKQEVHAAVALDKGVLHLVPYSPYLTVECPSTVEPTRINNKNT